MEVSDEVVKDLDRWIEKLMDCKPLSELEVGACRPDRRTGSN
jgi:hypothetical protein